MDPALADREIRIAAKWWRDLLVRRHDEALSADLFTSIAEHAPMRPERADAFQACPGGGNPGHVRDGSRPLGHGRPLVRGGPPHTAGGRDAGPFGSGEGGRLRRAVSRPAPPPRWRHDGDPPRPGRLVCGASGRVGDDRHRGPLPRRCVVSGPAETAEPRASWLDGAIRQVLSLPAGLPLRDGAQALALQLLRSIEAETLPMPAVYSTSRGTIRITWDCGQRMLLVSVTGPDRFRCRRMDGGAHPTRPVDPSGPRRGDAEARGMARPVRQPHLRERLSVEGQPVTRVLPAARRGGRRRTPENPGRRIGLPVAIEVSRFL